VTAGFAPGGPASLWLAYNEAENRQDFERMGELVAPALAATINGRAAVGSAEEDEVAMRALLAAYPDYRREVVEVLEIGDRVVARWRMRGTPADAASPVLDVAGCSIVSARDGVMVAADLYCDASELDRITAEAVQGL